MAALSRPRSTTRKVNNESTQQAPQSANTRPPHTTSNHHHAISTSSASDDDGPPAKKRKLVSRPKQSTLDHFISNQSAPLITQPHGDVLEKINGTRNVLNITEDDITAPSSGVATPKTSRVPGTTPQPANAPGKKEEKRSLRSHDDGPRLKSELAIYFPNYEDIIFEVEREEEFITVDTTLYIAEDAPKRPKPEQASPSTKSGKAAKGAASNVRNGAMNGSQYPATPQRSNSNQFNGSPSLNLDLISRTIPDNPEDPLSDDYYLKSHKRAERKEKQLRNIEKERAMHEKVQLDRLLDGLQGHDWLKVLGITGITDGEAKKFEAKRDYFIAEVQALVDKFRQWKEQEKKQRLDREAAQAAREEDGEDEDGSENDSVGPPSSDLNASAARQLQQETASALKSSFTIKLSSKGKEPASVTSTPRAPTLPFAAPSPDVPISSFYAKRHLREAALGKSRHGRNVTAFGHPLPEMPEREFELPEDYLTVDTLRANAREKRRRKRASVADAAG
ncbi:hypothetical protein LTR09_004721 [Extremus antarcticus]|uniref:Something about silencing protein 4 domain-containing protein n=1 Tax=Extremus antarcticus TaxID=702011 RepID=A0AAJ0DPQ2_9PEZI|nr:hypothetical protein LTR09_004721 [Extremus antarcticus]